MTSEEDSTKEAEALVELGVIPRSNHDLWWRLATFFSGATFAFIVARWYVTRGYSVAVAEWVAFLVAVACASYAARARRRELEGAPRAKKE